jgi:hypothetical protein
MKESGKTVKGPAACVRLEVSPSQKNSAHWLMNPEARSVLGAQPQLGAEFAGNMRNRHCPGVPQEKTNKREDHLTRLSGSDFFLRCSCFFSSLNPRYQRRIAIMQVKMEVAADVTSTKNPSPPSIT